jgi:hypothetical protein
MNAVLFGLIFLHQTQEETQIGMEKQLAFPDVNVILISL